MKELEKVSNELKEYASLYEKQRYELTSTPQSCFFSCICRRGWLSWPSMGGEALGIAKIICPVQGYARARKQEWVG